MEGESFMKIFNTLSGKTEEFKTLKDGVVNMYVCGPTVYSYAHVGNMCPVIIFDMVYRYFKYRGYDVTYASNFTDVDDKIIKAAKEAGITEKELTEKYIKIYLDDVKALNCLDIDYRPKVTETMDEIIAYIQLHLEEELSLNYLAEHFNKNASALSHSFRKETGISLTKYIQQTRISEAIRLFNTTDFSVSDVAVMVGYQDFSYFSKVFSAHVGMSPREYKKKR